MALQKTIVCEGRNGKPGGMTTESETDEKLCFFQGKDPVENCTSTCTFDNLQICLAGMMDDKHSCQAGGACCKAVQGPPPGNKGGRGRSPDVDNELAADILDLAEPLTFGEALLEFGGGSNC